MGSMVRPDNTWMAGIRPMPQARTGPATPSVEAMAVVPLKQQCGNAAKEQNGYSR